MNNSQQIRQFILSYVAHSSKGLSDAIVNEFDISNNSAHWHINKLIRDKKIMKVGKTKGTQYFLASGTSIQFRYKLGENTSEEIAWKEQIQPLVSELPKNVQDICKYGFTEIFNNAIDHSQGEHVSGNFSIKDGNIHIAIFDDGIGIFRKLQDSFHLSSIREAILHLTKGKVTTDKRRHSGEGIFFTSRIFDEFIITSSHMSFIRNNEDDWMLSKEKNPSEDKGTLVSMSIPLNTTKKTRDIFEKYTSSEDMSFSKTTVAVTLSKNKEESHISRSQAKRLLAGLDKFKEIVLDFTNVRTVGQGFVDEVFRVFQEAHPDIKITPIHANEDVTFMINRSIDGISPNQQSFQL